MLVDVVVCAVVMLFQWKSRAVRRLPVSGMGKCLVMADDRRYADL